MNWFSKRFCIAGRRHPQIPDALFFDIEYATSSASPSLSQRRVDLPANFIEGYSDSQGEDTQVAELNLNISDITVTAMTKKLSAKWSLESEQDLFAYHGLSAENELMSALSDEIAREIDRYIIGQLFSFAGAGTVTWHSTVPTSGVYSTIDPKIYNRTLYNSITDANNLIVKQRYRNATWLVASADDCARLEKLDEFRLFPAPDPVGNIVYGPNLFGTLAIASRSTKTLPHLR
ncbi:MAG TPA: hypothetical protein VEJ47_03495 [Candidatus Eremiobacteraceae bacterium]|nr:hypothetical protein [Candidatus Eremiobacteraceae bacterium]